MELNHKPPKYVQIIGIIVIIARYMGDALRVAERLIKLFDRPCRAI